MLEQIAISAVNLILRPIYRRTCSSISLRIQNRTNGTLVFKRSWSTGNNTEPLPITINGNGTESMMWKSRTGVSGMVVYEIVGYAQQNSPLLIVVGWKVPIFGRSKFSVLIGYEEERNFLDIYSEDRDLNKHALKTLLRRCGHTCTHSGFKFAGSITDIKDPATLIIDVST